MDIKKKAARIKQLKDDEVFTSILEEFTDAQISVFMNPQSSTEDREKAHNMVCALAELDRFMKAVLDDEKVFEHQHK